MFRRHARRRLGPGGCGQDMQSAVVAHRVGPQQLRLADRRFVADDIGEGLLRVEVEKRRDPAELEREVDQDDLVRPPGDGGDADVRGDRRRPDAALRAVDRDGPPGAMHRDRRRS